MIHSTNKIIMNYKITIEEIKQHCGDFGFVVYTENEFVKHTDYYFCENYRTVARERERLIKRYSDLGLISELRNGYSGHRLKPTLIDSLFGRQK